MHTRYIILCASCGAGGWVISQMAWGTVHVFVQGLHPVVADAGGLSAGCSSALEGGDGAGAFSVARSALVPPAQQRYQVGGACLKG